MQQSFYQQLLAKASFGFCYAKLAFDDKGQAFDYEVLDCNAAFLSYCGCSKDLLRENPSAAAQSFFANPSGLGRSDVFAEVLQSNQAQIFHRFHYTHKKWYKFEIIPNQAPYFSILIHENSNESIELVNRKFEKIGSLAKIGFFSFDLQRNQIQADDILSHFVGISTGALLDFDSIVKQFFFNDYERASALLKSILDKETENFELKITDSNGVAKWIRTIVEIEYEGDKARYILGVAQDISEEKNIREKLERQSNWNALLRSITTNLIFADSYNSSDKIIKMLEQTTCFLGMNRSYMFRYQSYSKTFVLRYEWNIAEIQKQSEINTSVSASKMPWWWAEMHSKPYIWIENLNNLPLEAAVEKNSFAAQGILSLLCIPVYNKNRELTGFFGFDAVKEAVSLDETELLMLKLLANTISNVLQKIEIEEALELVLNELEQFQSAVSEAVILSKTDIEGNIIYANENFLKTTKYGYPEIIGKGHNLVNSGYHNDAFWVDLWKTIMTGQLWRGEIRNRDKEGKYYWVDEFIVPIKKPDGQIKEFLSIQNDISDKKNTEDQLLKILENLHETQFLAQIGRWELDLVIDKLHWSEGIFSIFEVDAQTFSATYEGFLSFVHPEDREAVNFAYSKSLITKEKYEITHRLLLPDGRVKWVMEKCNTEFDEKGTAIRSVGSVQDITKIKEFELSLLDAKQKAEAANKVKSEFLANVSHEIRTPLNSVIGFTNLLLDANLPELQKQYVHHTNTSAYSLLTMINDILDISKIEAGKMELEEIPVALGKLLEEAIDIVRFGAMEKKLDIKLILPNPLPDLTYCDPIRLKQVLVNLLGNAVKFTERGFVALRVDYELREENEEQLGCFTFSVSDSGIGISEQQKTKLFKSFSQADASTTRKFGGSGLGLAISNSLVTMMGGGHISIESILGEGSRFYFSITKKISQKILLDSKYNPLNNNNLSYIISNNAFNILVVDDVQLNLKLIKVLLQKMLPNAVVLEAKNGVESINLFRETDFNLIFMDIQMPEMDGYAAVKLIRMLEKDNKKVPIVAITAGIVTGEKERCFAVGMNDYLTKPIIMNELKVILDKYLKN